MFDRFYWDSAKANIGCGALLVILGSVLISPIVAWLIKAIGWVLIVVGIVVVSLNPNPPIEGVSRQGG